MSHVALSSHPAVAARGLNEQQRADTPWSQALPVLSAGQVVLREVCTGDAPTLVSLLTVPQVSRYISTPPSTTDGFEQFITASQRLRASGEGACFVVTLRDRDTAIGLFQIRLAASASTDVDVTQFGGVNDSAEWGFAVGTQFWGTGVFTLSAALVLEFVFEQMGVHRLEARCAIKNGRGGRALSKLGAVPEGILRKAFMCGDEHMDQVLYAIVGDDWQECRDRARSVDITLVH